jgi:tetratricopeptide (TPR) repeat protein
VLSVYEDDSAGDKLRRETARAGRFADEGRLEEAGECLRALLAKHPDSSTALFNLAVVLTRQGRDDEALRYFTRVLKREADAVDALIEIGLIHYRAQEYAAAETVCRDALFLSEHDARVLNNLGVLAFVQDRFDEAENFFSRAVEIDPDNEDYAVNLRDTLGELQKK